MISPTTYEASVAPASYENVHQVTPPTRGIDNGRVRFLGFYLFVNKSQDMTQTGDFSMHHFLCKCLYLSLYTLATACTADYHAFVSESAWVNCLDNKPGSVYEAVS